MALSRFPTARHFTAAATIIGTATVFVNAALAQPLPIVIKSCTVLEAAKTAHPFWYPWGPALAVSAPVTDGIRIVYTNTANLSANRVAFEVNYRGDSQHVIDVGTFAPDVLIDHSFGNLSGDAFLGPNPNACVARAVRYDDGTIWRVVP